jgi:hypothetical protein
METDALEKKQEFEGVGKNPDSGEIEDLNRIVASQGQSGDSDFYFGVSKQEDGLPDSSPATDQMPPIHRASKIPEKMEQLKKMGYEEKVLPFKQLYERIKEEVRVIRSKFREIKKNEKITIEDPIMVDLLDLYADSKEMMDRFNNEINQIDLKSIADRKTVFAVYKYRACKVLAELKKETTRMEEIIRDAGFIPTKIHDIVESKSEDLVNTILKDASEGKRKKPKKFSIF